jgi:cAMP phosphodiesterase
MYSYHDQATGKKYVRHVYAKYFCIFFIHLHKLYADDIIILGDTKQDTVNSMSDLMKVCKHMGLSITQNKTKYMFMTREIRDSEDESDLEVNGL